MDTLAGENHQISARIFLTQRPGSLIHGCARDTPVHRRTLKVSCCESQSISIWSSNREAVLEMTVEQVVNNAGDGHLRDGNEASQELRGYLRICPSDSLFSYARYCLESSFDKSGIVLQLTGFKVRPIA